MGFLVYGRGAEIALPDRALAHLQVVISAKLRRDESFFFSWRDAVSTGGGRNAVWLDRSIPLRFRYSATERREPLNRSWIDALTASACTPAGLQLTAEPQAAGGVGVAGAGVGVAVAAAGVDAGGADAVGAVDAGVDAGIADAGVADAGVADIGVDAGIAAEDVEGEIDAPGP